MSDRLFVTPKDLAGASPCFEDYNLFKLTWPEGVQVTPATLHQAADLGLDIDWWFETFFIEHVIDYEREVSVLDWVFSEALDKAYAVRSAATEPAHIAYKARCREWDEQNPDKLDDMAQIDAHNAFYNDFLAETQPAAEEFRAERDRAHLEFFHKVADLIIKLLGLSEEEAE